MEEPSIVTGDEREKEEKKEMKLKRAKERLWGSRR